MNPDYSFISDWIESNSKVLDLGCGEGDLLSQLKQEHNVLGYGLEIDPQSSAYCVAKGVNVIEQDLNKGLTNFSFPSCSENSCK